MKPYCSCMKQSPVCPVLWLVGLLISLMLVSCEKEPICPCGLDEVQYVWETHRIRDTNYVKNTCFFLDHPDGPFVLPKVVSLNEQVEVFISVTSYEIQQNPEMVVFRSGRAFVDSFTLAVGNHPLLRRRLDRK